MKKNVLTYLRYMHTHFCEDEARKAFKNAACGWEYVWQKYLYLVRNNGRDGAIALFFCEIDSTLQDAPCDHIQTNYPDC